MLIKETGYDQYEVDGLSLEEWFCYHPVGTQYCEDAHQSINTAAQDFAETVMRFVKNEKCKEQAFWAIQQARMFANMGATVDELKEQNDT